MAIEMIDGWDSLIHSTETDIPLIPAVLEIARDEYPGLDVSACHRRIEALTDELAERVADREGVHEKLAALNQYLFDEQGFSGNQRDFYDPRNCYINDVLERKLGIPISLAVLQMACGERLGLPLEGVSFPGHFLVRVPVQDGILVLDPYHRGRSIGIDELRQRARPHFGDRDVDDAQLLDMLAPASHRAIVSRLLRNLKGVYAEREIWDKALRCADRLVRLNPEQAEDRRDRGLFYLRIGLGSQALEDLRHYLDAAADAEDADSVREAMIEAGRNPVARH
ncbi:MAG: tetratricopeptide repeat protein [Rhodobacteraceae bacterium]|nr:tetratricopeptide repeat protein [Xanthomonadales bacterium]MCB2127354.1 tetratricopeptide repeat protein [Paracoccaceae bacterium]